MWPPVRRGQSLRRALQVNASVSPTMKWRSAVAFILTLSSATAMAHPPYEGKRVVVQEAPNRIEIAASYIDGLFFTDPARVIVEVNGRLSAETDYYRDASFACARGRCLVASADSTFAVWPENVWIMADGSLTARNTWPVKALGGLVHLSEHLFGYTFAPLFLLIPVLQLRSAANRPSPASMASGCGQAVLTLASVGLLLIWLYVVTLLTELWVLWVLAIALLLFSAGTRMRRRRANNGLHQTGREGAAAPRPVVEARPAGEPGC